MGLKPVAREQVLVDSAMLGYLLDEVDACIYTKDIHGRYTYANRATLALWGLDSIAAILGKSDDSFFDLSRVDSISKNDELVLVHGQVVQAEERNFIRSKQEERVFLTVKKPLYDAHHQIIGLCGISTDISACKVLEQKLQRHNELLNLVLDNVGADIYIKDRERRYLYANQKVADVYGKSVEAIIGAKEEDLVGKAMSDMFSKLDEQVFQANTTVAAEEAFMGADGIEHHYWSVKMPIEYFNGETVLIGFSTDITELHNLKEELKRLANTDELTRLANRRNFYEAAERDFAHSRRHHTALSIITFDIDWFKQINDSYGHPVGDQALQAIAQVCSDALRKENLLARVGGEEFAVLLPDTNQETAKQIAERLAEVIKSITLTAAPNCTITASFGVASIKDADASFDRLFNRADQALYQAKQNGRNQVLVLN